jgi:hypothetical protein
VPKLGTEYAACHCSKVGVLTGPKAPVASRNADVTVIMAAIPKSRGTVGPASMDAGTQVPLDVIDNRLKDFRIFYHGDRPKTMLPQSREYYTHIVIEVSDDDPQPRPHRFQRAGFYQVVDLRVPDAGFLFEPL